MAELAGSFGWLWEYIVPGVYLKFDFLQLITNARLEAMGMARILNNQ